MEDLLGGITDMNFAADTSNRVDSRDDLGREEFYKILITQLSEQDPTEPFDASSMLDQLVSLQQLDTNDALIDSLGNIGNQQEFTMASNLIGSYVTAQDGVDTVEGLAERVGQKDGEVTVTILFDLESMAPLEAQGYQAEALVEGASIEGTVDRVFFDNNVPYVVLTDGLGGERTVAWSDVVKVTTTVAYSDINEVSLLPN
jgi:flagellar basal-body rod modification protein FlgD